MSGLGLRRVATERRGIPCAVPDLASGFEEDPDPARPSTGFVLSATPTAESPVLLRRRAGLGDPRDPGSLAHPKPFRAAHLSSPQSVCRPLSTRAPLGPIGPSGRAVRLCDHAIPWNGQGVKDAIVRSSLLMCSSPGWSNLA